MNKMILVVGLSLVWLTGCDLVEGDGNGENTDPCLLDPGSCETVDIGEFGSVPSVANAGICAKRN